MNDTPVSDAPGSGRKGGRSLHHIASTVTTTWQVLQTVVLGVVPVLIVGALLFLVYREMNRDTLEVAPIQVPARLAEAGLTPDVAASRLLDQIARAERAVRSENLGHAKVELAGQQPDFSVPIAGLSLNSLAALARSVFGTPARRLTGEIVLEDDKLNIRLRLAGFGTIADVGGFPIHQVDAALAAAAPEVWRVLQPRLYAWHIAEAEESELKVRERLRRMVATSQLDAETLNTVQALLARSYFRAGRAEDAIAVLNRLLENAPGYANGWYWRGRANRLLGHGDAAMEDFRQAQRLDRDAFWISVGIAEVLADRGALPEALVEVRKALAIRPDDAAALTVEAELLLANKQPREALVSARGALLTDSHNAPAWIISGRALLARGNAVDALESFDQAARYAPTSQEAQLRRVEALMVLNRPNDASAALERVTTMGALSPRLEGIATRLRALLRESSTGN
jgi:tetratricopeptide (TPR) repeat protein